LANPKNYIDPENRIINGAFDFWQRGTSFTTANAYMCDRWFNGLTGGSFSFSRQTFTAGDTLGSNNPTYFARASVSGQTLSSQHFNIAQPIESVRSYAGQTITVLGWARRSSGSGNMAVEGRQTFGTGGSPSSEVTGISPTTVTLTSSWAPFAVTMSVPSITGKTLGTTSDGGLVLNFWFSAGSDFNARSNSLGIQTIGVDLWGVHIKVGTHTTAATDLYKQPELGPELARCQRYARTYPFNALQVCPEGSSGNNVQAGIFFPPMRTTPTATNITVPSAVVNGFSAAYSTFYAFGNSSTDAAVVAQGITASAYGSSVLLRSGNVFLDAEL
jgi:hypothetical protein